MLDSEIGNIKGIFFSNVKIKTVTIITVIFLFFFIFLKILFFGGAWVAQLVKCVTLDFGSGHDLAVRGFKPCVGLFTDSTEPAWDFLSLKIKKH